MTLFEPSELAALEERAPGSADRLLRMMEREQMLSYAIRFVGQLMGFVVAVGFGAAATWLISSGREVSGTLLATIDLVALVAVFVVGRPTEGR